MPKTNKIFQEIGSAATEVQLLRTGEFDHTFYGEMIITQDMLREMKKNFDDGVRGVDLAVDYSHESWGEAAGWIENIILKEHDNELWIQVKWTDEATDKLNDKRLRYISAEFETSYKDAETGKKYGAVLLGAGLTNRPFIKKMEPILNEMLPPGIQKKFVEAVVALAENQSKPKKEDNIMTFEEISKAIKELSEDEKVQLVQLLGGKVNIEEDKAKLDERKKDNKVLAENELLKKKLDEKDAEFEKAKKESIFNTMLSEGKVVESQRVAYLESDMETFIKNSVEINLDEAGHGGDKKDGNDEDAVVTKLDELANKKMEADKNLKYATALSEALNENPELQKQYNEQQEAA
ncbi:MAG: phage protease [Candidatus Anammoxibacter sp.]